MRYRVIEQDGPRRTFVLVLDMGEEVIEAVLHFATELGIAGASISGIGAVSRAQVGWFNPATAEFRQNDIDEQAEVLAIAGNIAEGTAEEGGEHAHLHGSGEVKLHMHISMGLGDATVRGGHLVSAWVSPTMELIVTEADTHMLRGVDAVTGLVLLEPRAQGEATALQVPQASRASS